YFLLIMRRLPRSTLFPYTTLFRSFVLFLGYGASRANVLRSDWMRKVLTIGPSVKTLFWVAFVTSLIEQFCFVRTKKMTVSAGRGDRKSTRLNSSHVKISYAVFCSK